MAKILWNGIKFVLSYCLTTFVIIIAVCFYLTRQVNSTEIDVTQYEVCSDKIDSPVRIVQLSDLHDNTDIEHIASLVNENTPDIIVTTGDMFDSSRSDLANTLSLYENLRAYTNCPIFYIAGNHETGKPELLAKLCENLKLLNVTTLKNECVTLNVNGNNINVIGFDNAAKYSAGTMNSIQADNTNYNVVLCHFPENFDKLLTSEELYYGQELSFDMNLILSGHAHGGQFRLAGYGLYAPNQGLFPKWTSGIHSLTDNEFLIISRGLGNSSFPIRINNNPEIVVVDIKPNETTK